MGYLLTFLEGIITFISPCLLPMLPIYISYFAGRQADENRQRALCGAAGFVAGFTVVFVCLGAFAGTLGILLSRYSTLVNLVLGAVMVIFGLSFMGLLHLKFLRTTTAKVPAQAGFFSSALFGLVFSISWTPCVGTFLGSALMLAASSGGSLQGIGLLLCFSAGLGLPFILSAVLIEKLRSAFDFIKRHYRAVNIVCGALLIAVGILMATGLLGEYLALLSV